MQEYLSLIQIYNKVRFTGVSPIWECIETKVKTQLHAQIGELYITDNGGVNPFFEELIKKGPSIRLNNLEDLYTEIKESTFHAALSAPSPGHMFYQPALSPFKTDKVPEFMLMARL